MSDMPADPPLIMVIEDEKPIRRFVKASVEAEGYRCVEAEGGRQGLIAASSQPPDLVILDLGLPDMDGVEVIDELRRWSQAPIVVLSARDRDKDKVSALDRGADDYLTKPFSVNELLARIRVGLRHQARTASMASAEAVFEVEELKVDQGARRVFVRGQEVHLTPIEYRLLTTLVRHAGRVLTHRQILQEVWGPGNAEEVHYLRVFMANLRRKIEADPTRPRYLLTEQGVGYRLADE